MAFALRHSPEQLYCRRQFALGQEFLPDLPDWQRLSIAPGLCLTAHPELAVTHRNNATASVTILGELLEPMRPDASNDDIAGELLTALNSGGSLGDLTTGLSRYAGRWILILVRNHERRLVHDAAGTRQVFYTSTDQTRPLPLWCASQPGLIAPLLGLQFDPEVTALTSTPAYKADRQYWLPGDRSVFREIRLLLPNRFLDLSNGQVLRYWPTCPPEKLSLSEAVERSAAILEGTLRAITRRHPVTVPTTAGIDSRMTLAGSRDVSDRAFYYTFVCSSLTAPDAADVAIPAALLPRLGLTHHIVECPDQMDEQFEECFMRNFPLAHRVWGRLVQGFYEHIPDGHVRLTSAVSEVAKQYYGAYYGSRLTGAGLARMTKRGETEFTRRAFDEWIEGLPGRGDAQTLGYDTLDLFYWEQRAGCWAAMNFTESGVVQEVMSPFNCRDLLVTMLGVKPQLRCPPSFKLQMEIIRSLWPEALSLPINPKAALPMLVRIKRAARRTVKSALLKSGMWKRRENPVG